MPTTVNVPRHYYTVASVEFCASQDNTNHIQWRGFGTGVCKTKNDFGTHIYPKYGAFKRVSLINDGRIFNYTDPVTGAAMTRTFAEEMTNYANWYAFYRTRILAAKTTSSVAFNILDNTYRVGFHVFNTPLTKWVNVNDFDATQRATWYSTLTSVAPATGSQTPTLDASLRIGDLFQNGAGSAGLPAHTDPITPGVTCQSNYHILFTDGYTNQLALPTVVGQVDGGTVPAFPPDPDPVNRPEITLSTLRGLVGSPWPNPYRDTTGIANSLSDIAMHYWMNDLRPGLTNNVPSGDGRAGGDVDPNVDVAWWQHLNFSAISFGSEGILDASNVAPTVQAIATGAQPWFTAPNLPSPPNKPLYPTTNPGATAVDDLWHATVNSRGKFVYAKTPLEVAYGLGSILAGISNNRKARVGASFSGRALSATNNFVFQATIEPGWTGELKRVRVDPTTALELPYASPPDWSAALNLNTLLQTPVVAPALDTDNPWFLNRKVVTRNAAGTAVPFRYANLSASQLATLAPTATQQQKVIAYLRGGSTFGNGPTPQLIEGTNIGQFRKRQSKLGDLSNSKPMVVGPPTNSWSDSTDPGYSAFKAAQAGRSMRVFVGSNDGMLHSFDATTGDEVFAYVPSALFNSAKDDGGKNDRGIHALTYQDGGAPIFKHHMYVDGAPRSTDVDLSGGAGTDWRTIVVGGLGKGGNMYYAIDATDPTATTEATAAAKILWEFTLPGSAVSYGRPIIAKTRAHGWVVIIASGYNSTANSGRGRLYFLSVVDGSILKTMDTPVAADIGTVTSPSGFTQISGFTKDYRNQTIEQVYGGDLNGRLWRFDVSDPNAGELDGRPLRDAHRPVRRAAADHHATADRDRPQQRHRPLRVHRHGPAARYDRSHVPVAGADADDVRVPRRHADDAYDDRSADPAALDDGGGRRRQRDRGRRAQRLVRRPGIGPARGDRRRGRPQRGRVRRHRHPARPLPHVAARVHLCARVRVGEVADRGGWRAGRLRLRGRRRGGHRTRRPRQPDQFVPGDEPRVLEGDHRRPRQGHHRQSERIGWPPPFVAPDRTVDATGARSAVWPQGSTSTGRRAMRRPFY